MRSPITAMHQNLLWTRKGTVWAMWRLTPAPYGFRSDEDKQLTRAAHTALFRSLRGEALLLGLCASTDPASVVQAMIEGIDLEERPEWAMECEATLDFLEQIDLGRRAYWLAVPLANRGGQIWAEPMRSSWAQLKDDLSMPRTLPTPRQVDERLAQAETIRKALPRVFEPRPATVAEMVWIYLHSQQRGLGLDHQIPAPDASDLESELLSSPSAIPSPVLDPCGQSDLEGKAKLSGMNILDRRYLKVVNAETGTASYQTMSAVTETPSGGISFPGGEWIGRLDESGVTADWAMRLTVRSREAVFQRNRRANNSLNDQLNQQEAQTQAGGSSHLQELAGDLAEYQRIMESDQLEVEVEATTIFLVGAPTAAAVQEATGDLRRYFNDAQYKLSTDPTAQEKLWWSALPGSPTPRVVRELSQITPARYLSAAVPLITSELGDEAGSMFALEIASGRVQPILVDVAGSSSKLDVSPAVALCGELGSGKSVAMKKLAMDAVDRGADLVAIDRTDMGEWGHALESMPGSVIVEVSEDAAFSFDPLRIFEPAKGARVAQSFLTALLSITPTSDAGVIISEVLRPETIEAHRITSLGAMITYLEKTCDLPGARELAGMMNVYARRDFGRAVFDETLPPLDITTSVIVFWTHLLELPDADELNSAHRFAQMKMEKLFGRAVYALITAIARHRCFLDRGRLGVFAVDEAHSVTCSPEGTGELKIFLRDGRKHQASLIIGSHDPIADFGDEVMRRLISFRVLLRHRDKGLAERGLRWLLGVTDDTVIDPDLIDLISEQTSPVLGGDGVPLERRGECLIRDFRGRIGQGKILVPARADRAKAVLTTPTSSAGLRR